MTPGGLSASLPGRLTESTVWSEERIWPGLDSLLAELVVPLDGRDDGGGGGGGVHLHGLHRHKADLGLGLE